eukprot:CAMPEP_0116822720 /NCGR_PEP_ID=MMETSP0418-20121206/427_1 /TAXON_ID=1158023 /ORGANISM="Astrosyne radiata, Strain 13vi08-1A" /LENGTH=258 /DNA_ID=CAMNT_0004450869 /DNA_START=8 /DNA_END=780 /DNA_ORIENTATION=-
MVDPALIQRMLMVKSKPQLRQICFTLAGAFGVLFLVFMLLGIAGHQLYPTLSAEALVPNMIKELLPVGLRGLMMVGIFAVVMASAESYLHAAGVTLVHDVIRPFAARRKVKITTIHWVRWVTLLVGLLIIGLGLTNGEDVYSLIETDLEFTVPLLTLPFFLGVLGLKPSSRAFYVATLVTLGTFLAAKQGFVDVSSHNLPLVCILANGVTFFLVHYARHQGFAFVRLNRLARWVYVWQPEEAPLEDQIARGFRTVLPT